MQIGRAKFAAESVSCGVVQGSVLGTILFALYISDLPLALAVLDCAIKLFADDVKVYKHITNPNDRAVLQSALNLPCEWTCKLKLNLSVEKCIYFQLGYHNFMLVYTLNSYQLSPSNRILDLGLNDIFDLKPDAHCASIATKANSRARLIIKSFLSHDPQLLTRAFVIYVRPLLEYCTPVWSPYNKSNVNIIENVQRSFTRNVFLVCRLRYACDDERLEFLGLKRLELRRIYADLVFLFKLLHRTVSCNLLDHINYVIGICTITRGHRYKLTATRTNKLVFSTCFTNRVVPLRNYLPDSYFIPDVSC